MKRRSSFSVPPTRREAAALAPEPEVEPEPADLDPDRPYFGSAAVLVRVQHRRECPVLRGMPACTCRGGANVRTRLEP